MDIGLVNSHLVYPRGGERQVCKLAYYLNKMGNDVTIYTYEKTNPYFFDDELKNIDIIMLNKKAELSTLYEFGINLPRWYYMNKKLNSLIKDHEILNYHNHPSQWVSHFNDIPSIWTCNEPSYYYFSGFSGIKGKLINKPANLAIKFDDYMTNVDLIFALDSKMKEAVENRYSNRDVKVVGSGAELERNVIHIQNDYYDIICVGPIQDQRHTLDIVNAVSLLKDEIRKNIRIYLVGKVMSKEVYENIQKVSHENSIEIIFYESISNEELYDLYDIADLSIFVPELQPWGIFPLETILAGIPTIISDACGITDIMTKDYLSNFIVTTGDIVSLSNKIEEMIENEEFFINKTVKMSNLIKKDYSWESYSKRIFKEFSEII